MRFWKKIYLITFFLFLVFLNGGIFFVFQIAYESNLNEEKKRTVSENKIVLRAVEEEIAAFEDTGAPGEHVLQTIMQDYEEMYRENELTFELWQEGKLVYAEGITDGTKEDTSRGGGLPGDTMTLEKEDGKDILILASDFEVMEHTYRLVVIRSLSELSLLWNKLRLIFLMSSGVMSVILAIVLYFIMRRITRPLNRLSHLTREVAEGNYTTIEIKGTDEIAELGSDFNAMTAAIQSRIESQERFIANLAHEMRTPLTSIGGYSEYLLRGTPDEERRYQALDYIMRESRRIQRMSNQLLQLAQIQKKEFEMETINIREVCEEAYQSCLPMIENKKLCAKISPKETEGYLTGAKELLVCLIRNLLENAIRACDEGGRIEIEIHGQSVSVTDDGAGMEPDEIARITEPFYRIDKARSSTEGGTGLGLALCSEIAKLHGAELRIFSRKMGTAEEAHSGNGRGTKVTLEFPHFVFHGNIAKN